ncbi:MAG: nickel insertion protein [Pseudomonadota bacterium]
MSGDVLLLMVQVDDATGEVLGEVMQQAAEMGAKNVQLLSSQTKKGRPGHVLMLDVLADQETEFAALLVGELGVWGYRVLHSYHKHFEIERHTADVNVQVPGQPSRSSEVRIKRILQSGTCIRIKAEFDDLRDLCAVLKADGVPISISVLKSHIETAIGTRIPDGPIEIRLGAA